MQSKIQMVPLDGVEPPTQGLGNLCSSFLSYRGDFEFGVMSSESGVNLLITQNS